MKYWHGDEPDRCTGSYHGVHAHPEWFSRVAGVMYWTAFFSIQDMEIVMDGKGGGLNIVKKASGRIDRLEWLPPQCGLTGQWRNR